MAIATIISIGIFVLSVFGIIFSIKHNKIESKKEKFLAIFLIFTISISSYFVSNVAIYSKGVEGHSEWIESNDQRYLYVESDNRYDLGYLQGEQLSSEIFHLKNLIRVFGIKYYDISYKTFLDYSMNYEEYIHEDYRLEMQGMADGVSSQGIYVSYEDILLQNCWFDIVYGILDPYLSLNNSIDMGCTIIGKVNPNATTIVGQNLDFDRSFVDSFLFKNVAFVHTKFVGTNPFEVFSIRSGGGLSMPFGKNAFGVYSLINLVQTNLVATYSTPTFIRTRIAFEQSENAIQFAQIMTETNATASYNLLIADNSSIIGMQTIPYEFRMNYNDTIVSTNRYLYDDFNQYLQNTSYSLTRQLNAESYVFPIEELTHQNLKDILNLQGDSDETSILRKNTVAFITSNIFGIGNMKDNMGGIIPI